MKKICFVSSYACIGGAEKSLQTLILGCRSRGYEPFLVLGELGKLSEWCANNAVRVYVVPQPSLKIRRIHNITFNYLYFIFRMLLIFINEKVTLVHTNTLRSRIYCLPLTFLPFIRFIAHVRDIEPLKLNKLLISRYDYTIAISNAVKNSIITCDEKINCKIIVIYNGVEQPDWGKYCNNTYKSSDIAKSEKIKIGVLGRFDEWKCQHVFVKAAINVIESGLDVDFYIYGDALRDSEKEYKNNVLKEIKKYHQKIKYMGFVDDPYEAICFLDLVVCPSDNEPFGRVVIEAMAAKKIVIGSNNGGIPEILGVDNEQFMCAPRSAQELSALIIKIINDFDYYQRTYSKKLFSLYLNRFSVGRVLDELIKLYKI